MAKNSFNSISLTDNVLLVNNVGYPLDAVSTSTIPVSNSSFVGIGCTDNGNGTCTLVVNGQEIVVNGEESAPIPVTDSYLTFSSPDTFTLKVVDNRKYWDGTLQYSTDATVWNTWGGTTTLSSSNSGVIKYLYLRGVGNTYITGSLATNTQAKWVLTGNSISCNGNIETLLDYETVINGQHPPMAAACYRSMFRDCTALTSAPALPATTLANYCYQYMFSDCTALTSAPALPATTLAHYCYLGMFTNCNSLTSAPALPATTLADYCYYYMFRDCTALTSAPALPATTLANGCYQYMFVRCGNVKISTTQTGIYQNAYRIPVSGTGTTGTGSLDHMLKGTGGTFTGTPTINTTYYTSNTIVMSAPEPGSQYIGGTND